MCCWLVVIAGYLLPPAPASGQPYSLQISPVDEPAVRLAESVKNRRFYDSAMLRPALEKLTGTLHGRGHLLASLDQLHWDGDTLKGQLEAGRRFYIRLSVPENERERSFATHSKYRQYLEKQLQDQLNSGYPFAKVALDSAHLRNDTLHAFARIDKGPFLEFDTVVLRGKTKLKKSFLQRYLFISPGSAYSEKLVNGLQPRLEALGYVESLGFPRVDFFSGKARVMLELADRDVNELDGVLGFLPAQNAGTGKLLLTGQLKASLHNLFGTGKYLGMYWHSFNIGSQQLQLDYRHPVVLGSPLNLEAGFSQLKQDTSFVNRKASLAFSLPLNPFFVWSFGAGFQNNSILAPALAEDADGLRNADSNITDYTMGLAYSSLDDVILPGRGSSAKLEASAGRKEIYKNPVLDPSLYEGVELATVQVELVFSGENYLPVFKRSVLVQQLQLAAIFNDQLFQNDLYRLGGLMRQGYSLRGFNENQFFSSRYALLSLEYRLLVDEGSYLQGFVDQALMAAPAAAPLYTAGAGLGIVIDMGPGVFHFAGAVGSAGAQGFDFAQPKIHFGFTNRF